METYTHLEGDWVLTDTALCIEKEDLDPDAVTAALGIRPSGTRKPGPSRWRPAGDTRGLWILECNERTSRDLGEQVAHVLSSIEPRKQELQKLITSGCHAYFRIRGFAGNGASCKLPSPVLARLAALGIQLKVSPNINER